MTIAELNESHVRRDYSLAGSSTSEAIEKGLASADWYHSDVPRNVGDAAKIGSNFTSPNPGPRRFGSLA